MRLALGMSLLMWSALGAVATLAIACGAPEHSGSNGEVQRTHTEERERPARDASASEASIDDESVKLGEEYFQRGKKLEQEAEGPRDLDLAVEQYWIAARNHHVEALASLERHAALGFAAAQSLVADMYFNGEGKPKDQAKAMELFFDAAGKGDTWALSTLGSIFENGEGVRRDPTRAFEYYKRCVEQGGVYANNSLARCYENGTGTDVDYVSALACYKLAAEASTSKRPLLSVGRMYEEGKGTERDLERAIAVYEQAVAHGLKFASNRIRRLESELKDQRAASARELQEAPARQAKRAEEEALAQLKASEEGRLSVSLASAVHDLRPRFSLVEVPADGSTGFFLEWSLSSDLVIYPDEGSPVRPGNKLVFTQVDVSDLDRRMARLRELLEAGADPSVTGIKGYEVGGSEIRIFIHKYSNGRTGRVVASGAELSLVEFCGVAGLVEVQELLEEYIATGQR